MAVSSQTVHEKLRETAKQVRLARGARFAVSGIAVGVFFLTAFLFLDAVAHFGPVGRWIAFLLTVLPLLAGLALAIPKWMGRISEESVARRLEQSCTGAGNVLISAVQFDRELAPDSAIRVALFKEMTDPFPGVNWADVFDFRLFRRFGYALAATGVLLLAWAMIQPGRFANSAARVLLPASDIPPLTHTRITMIRPGTTKVLHGSSVEITAELGGAVPADAWIGIRDFGGKWQRHVMNRTAGLPKFAFRWNDIRTPLQYYVEAGDARSVTHKIEVRTRTGIRTRAAEIVPPPYTHARPVTLKDFAVVTNVLPGSQVTVTLEFSNPVPVLTASGLAGDTAAVEKIDASHWRIRETVMNTHEISLEFRDGDELTGAEAFQVAIVPDAPPKIIVSDPPEGKELIATRESALPVRFTATDNFGLGSVALYRSTDDNPTSRLVREWADVSGRAEFSAQMQIDFSRFVAPEEETATFILTASDQNSVTGPCTSISRPLVVRLNTAKAAQEKRKTAEENLRGALEKMITFQERNLQETRTALVQKNDGALDVLVARQVQIGELGRNLASSADELAPVIRASVVRLNEKELPAASISLRNASTAKGDSRTGHLNESIGLQTRILAVLRGSPEAAAAEAVKSQMENLIASVEDLLRTERDLLRDTRAAGKESARSLSDRQDALGDRSIAVRKDLERNSANAALGDQEFRTRIGKAASMFGELKVYEEMLATAEKLSAASFPEAAEHEKQIVVNLGKISELLNQWQIADAGREAEELKQEAAEMKDKLGKLAEIQKEILEKSRELAHKDDFRPEDLAAAGEIAESKQLMSEVVEQMLKDAHVFPDLKPSNELRSQLTSIYEDVLQTDKEQAAEGTLKPQEIAVQKEDGLLKAIEEAQKIAEDMEMWLPNKNETEEWKLENFDVAEMPEIPNLPLPDAFEDLVGEILKEQESLNDQVQDAASNQALAMNPANGWEVRDGPMPGFGAQGRSGNERPNQNEQTGRSSGGREGMSSGEMVGDTTSNLEGRQPQVRRTNDPMQQGQVNAPGQPADAKATGGGKAAGVSERAGMDGNAPLRPTSAPRVTTNDALAVQQSLIAEKTSKRYAQASLLYLKADKLAEVSRWMDESKTALREGRIKDFQTLHRRIVARLQEAKGDINGNGVLAMPDTSKPHTGDKFLPGGDEGESPAAYRERVADYYRSLQDTK